MFIVELWTMKNKYTITGMTCGGCVAKVKAQIESLPQVLNTTVQLQEPHAIINSTSEIPESTLQEVLSEKGNYRITKIEKVKSQVELELPEIKVSTYKPLILIISFILGGSILSLYPFNDFSGEDLMRHFMAGFFIVFSFFKLLNIKGFSDSYAMYDIVAAEWKGWGLIYPFVELGLGVMYWINFEPQITNWVTIVVLGVSSIGVIKSNLDKKKIKCACLGDVFNLPMSTVTIVEDLLMVGMAAYMLL